MWTTGTLFLVIQRQAKSLQHNINGYILCQKCDDFLYSNLHFLHTKEIWVLIGMYITAIKTHKKCYQSTVDILLRNNSLEGGGEFYLMQTASSESKSKLPKYCFLILLFLF